MALATWKHAHAQVAQLKDRPKCDQLLAKRAVAGEMFQNGRMENTVTMAQLFAGGAGASIIMGGADQYHGETVAGFLSSPIGSNAPAVACLGCGYVYLNDSNIYPSNTFGNEENVIHEALHNLTGLTDGKDTSNI
jgi:hypothetical protein